MPTSVSAIRTGALPSRPSGVTVFVTKASRLRATSGAVSASRQPLALSSRKDGPFYAEAPELAVDLDHAPVAGAVAARHRRLPRELRVRRQATDLFQHRLRAAGEDVAAGRHDLRHVARLEDDLSIGHERGRLGVPGAAEAEYGGRAPEPLREIGKRCDADPAADEQRPLHLEPEAVAERAENAEPVAGLERAERARSGADRVDQEGELAGRREADAHRPRQQPARRLEHEELSGHAGIEAGALDAQERVRADLLGAGDARPFALRHRSAPAG